MSNFGAIVNGVTPPPKQQNTPAPSGNFGAIVNGYGQQTQQPTGNPLDKLETPLPPGAIDRLPNGEAYYGPGIGGWWNGVRARMNEQSYRKLADGTYAPTETSGLQYAARGIKEGIGGVLNAFTAAQEGAQSLLSAPQTLEDIADQSKSWLPDINQGLAARNWVYNLAGPSVIGNIYNTARILTGSRKMAWEDVVKTAQANAELSSRLGGSQTVEAETINRAYQAWTGKSLFDANTRAEFIRRFNAGENPDYIVADIANPFVEMAYDLVVDPTNLAGMIIDDVFKAKKIADARKGFAAFDEVKDGWKAIESVQSVADEAPVLADMATKLVARNTAADVALTSTADLLNPFRLDNLGKMDKAADVVGNMFGVMISTFKNSPDDLGEVLRAATLLGSKNADEVKDGLQIIARTNQGIGQMLTSPEGMQTAQFLNKMLTDETGKITGTLMTDVVDAMKNGKSIPEIIQKWEKVSTKTLNEMYPSVLEMAKQPEKYNVPEWAVNIAKTHETLQQKFKIGAANKAFSTMYITTNPGAGFRNLFNNVFTTAVDMGPAAAMTAVGEFGTKVLNKEETLLGKIEDMLGFVPRSATRGLKSGTGGGPVEGGQNLIKFIGDLTDKGERATSEALTYYSLKRTLGQAMKENVAIATLDDLRALGVPEDQVQHLIGLTQKYHNPEEALKVWMGEGATGALDTFRDIRVHLNPVDIDAVKNTPGMEEVIHKVLEAPSLETAKAAIQNYRGYWKQMASKANALLPGIEDGSEVGNELLEAVNHGMLKAGTDEFNIKLRAQRMATEGINDATRKVFGKAMTENPDQITILRQIEDNLNETRKQIVAASQHDDLRNATFNLFRNNSGKTDTELMEIAKKTIPGYAEYWAKNPITETGFKDHVWQYYFKERDARATGALVKFMDENLKALGEASQWVGRDLTQDQLIGLAQQDFERAWDVMKADLYTPEGVFVDPVRFWMDKGKPKDAIRSLAFNNYGIASGPYDDKRIINIINKYAPEGAEKIKSLDGVTVEQARAAFEAQRAEKAAGEVIATAATPTMKIDPPLMDGMMPSSSQAARENIDGVNALLDRLESSLNTKWGRGSAIPNITPEQVVALEKWKTESLARLAETRAIAARVAQQERDFALLNYGQKTTLDRALGYIMPYQFWYSRSYGTWMKRLAMHPEVISRYANYRQWLEQQHASLPDWWKYNVSINDLPGVNVQNPMYMNLESTLNPLNGLTGIDFNDQNKITGDPGTFENFWTNTLNDIGKFGPSVWTPLTMATAAYLYVNGEKDAAQRWGGRLIPQTAPVKALGALAGIQLETDPIVMLLSGKGVKSIDAYEARRVGRALVTLAQNGEITREQAVEAAQKQEGEIWDKAAVLATKSRAVGGTLASFFFGTGFKNRSESDMEIDKFYEDYNSLWKMSDRLSPQEFKVTMDALRERYPFMDAVLLSKKGGLDRDRAYAYTVMGRIAPGDTKKIMEAAGLPPEVMDKFYADKGKMDTWKEDDRMKFMAGMISIGTTLAIPPTATQQEWTSARNAYKTLSDRIAGQLGQDIWQKVDAWYAIENPDQKDAYIRQHPEVQQAMDAKAYGVANDPLLASYYNGLANIEQYWKGEMRKDVLNKLGADYYDLLKEREGIYTKADLAAFDRLHPQLKRYNALADRWNAFIQRKLLEYGKSLPMKEQSVMQNVPMESTGQQAIQTALTPAPVIQWQDISNEVPETLKTAIYNYYTNNRPLSAAEKTVLNRVAKYLGTTSDDILQAAFNALP